MANTSIEDIKNKLLSKKKLLELDLTKPKSHISKCDIYDAADALLTREGEHRLYQHKLMQISQIESTITRLSNVTDIECETCGISILNRLDIVPNAQHCVRCQTKIEQLKT